MDKNFPELPFLSNIGLMITYKCTVACPHCIVKAGPHRKEEMLIEHSLNWIKQASDYQNGKIKCIALTGGEPFYNIQNLDQISTFCRTLGLIVSVVTNAYWASTKFIALEILSKLPAIQMLSFSTDVYHQKFIPFNYIENAIYAAKELGRLYNIAVCTDNEKDEKYKKVIEDLKAIGETENIRISITFPAGRAQKQVRFSNYSTIPEPTVGACALANSPVVFPDGKVNACIGPLLTLPPLHPMILGDLKKEQLSKILDRSELNPILQTIRIWGPYKLVKILSEFGFETLLPDGFIFNCPCDICYKLLSDTQIVNSLKNVLENTQLIRTIAYGRLYYLNEKEMVERYNFESTECPVYS